MQTVHARKYFILFNTLATLSQHLPPLQRNKRIATIIVSATVMSIHTTTATNVVNKSDFAEAPTAPRTTTTISVGASAFVDEVLPHNDSVATITVHAEAIDSSNNINNNNNNSNYNTHTDNNNNNADDFEKLLKNKLQEEQRMARPSAGQTAATFDEDGIAIEWPPSPPPLPPPDHRLLSRKRRYLIFPEGSSFQVVYDGIFGIVDYTNYLILGITVALAWELPTKPQGEVIEEIANRLKNYSPHDTAEDDTYSYIDTADKQSTTIIKQAAAKSARPNYINLMTATSPAASNVSYTNNRRRLPVHPKYYYFNNGYSNKYDYYNNNNKKYYYARPQMTPAAIGYNNNNNNKPSHATNIAWRSKDNDAFYYKVKNNSKKWHNENFKLSTLKVNPFGKWTQQQQQQRLPVNNHRSYKSEVKGASEQNQQLRRPDSRHSNTLHIKPIPSRSTDGSKIQVAQEQKQRQQQHQQSAARLLQQQEAASGFQRQPPPAIARKHRIYPVFGKKRSIADEHEHQQEEQQQMTLSATQATEAAAVPTTLHSKKGESGGGEGDGNAMPHQQPGGAHSRYRRSGIVGAELSRLERIHVRHHRSTRQALYEKIEKYLDKLNIKHSHHCILRTLCETGQKSKERSPGTFVGEIMRAIFTIPEAVEEDVLQNRIHYKHQRYDRANAFAGDCAKEYSLCQQSLWNTHFVK